LTSIMVRGEDQCETSIGPNGEKSTSCSHLVPPSSSGGGGSRGEDTGHRHHDDNNKNKNKNNNHARQQHNSSKSTHIKPDNFSKVTKLTTKKENTKTSANTPTPKSETTPAPPPCPIGQSREPITGECISNVRFGTPISNRTANPTTAITNANTTSKIKPPAKCPNGSPQEPINPPAANKNTVIKPVSFGNNQEQQEEKASYSFPSSYPSSFPSASIIPVGGGNNCLPYGKGQVVEDKPLFRLPVNLQICKRVERGGPLTSPADFDIGVFYRYTPTSRLTLTPPGQTTPQRPFHVNPSTGCAAAVQVPRNYYFIVGEQPARSIQGGYNVQRSGSCEGRFSFTDPRTEFRCDLVNSYVPPIPPGQARLIITKIVINDDGHSKRPSDFALQTRIGPYSAWTEVSPFFTTQGGQLTTRGSQTSQTVARIIHPGQYYVGERGDPGYTFIPCGGTIRTGETRYCTVYNDDRPVINTPIPQGQSRLVIAKKIINDDGGTATLNDFIINVYVGHSSIPCRLFIQPEPPCSQTITRPFASFHGQQQIIIPPDFYEIFEGRLPNARNSGYVSHFGYECIGHILPGETMYCTVINDDTRAQVPTTPVP
jgi:hypothetical protein